MNQKISIFFIVLSMHFYTLGMHNKKMLENNKSTYQETVTKLLEKYKDLPTQFSLRLMHAELLQEGPKSPEKLPTLKLLLQNIHRLQPHNKELHTRILKAADLMRNGQYDSASKTLKPIEFL
ncbi:hypothetical protein K9K77_03485 [Candidatus Babeliales bacterium]|nr:hypothetical protein [Candidatus Babeliales bacterium]